MSQAFGWPQVKTWAVWRASLSDAAADACFATRQTLPIEPHAALSELRKRESEAADEAVESGGALAAVAGFEPTGWTCVRFRLWRDAPPAESEGGRTYRIGHLSRPRGGAAGRSAL